MSGTIKVNGMELATGLSWSRISSSKIRAEVEQIAKPLGAKFGVVRHIEEENGERWEVGLATDNSGKGKPSAAGVLASIVENALVIQKIDESRFWICGVFGHEVLPGYDDEVDEDDAAGRISDLARLLAESEADFEVVADEAGLLVMEDASQPPRTFAEFIEGFEISKAVYKKNRISGLGGRSKQIRLVLIAAAAGGLAYYIYGGFDSSPVVKTPIIPKHHHHQLVKSGPSKAQIIQQAKAEERHWLASKLGRYSPGKVIASVKARLDDTPHFYAGWNLVALTWQYGQGHVHSHWVRQQGSTALIFKKSVQGAVSFTDQASKADLPLPADLAGTPIKPGEVMAYLDSGLAPLQLNHLLTIEDLHWKTSLDKAATKRPHPIKGLKNKQLSEKRVLPVKVYKLTLNGDSEITFRQAASILDRVPNLVIRTVSIKTDKGLTWNIIGAIYVH